MYADRVEAEQANYNNRSIKDRLNGASLSDSGRRRPISGKRRREDNGKWEHDLFDDNGPQVSGRRVGPKDLRLKLQRKSIEQSAQNVWGSIPGGGRDLREKLSGPLYSRPVETKPPELRPKPASEISKPPRKSVIARPPVTEIKNVAGSLPKRKPQQKVGELQEPLLRVVESVQSFLQSLGLEKYSITFQAEEVDMRALVHMNDGDLKAMGIPMGPRKKLLLAIESKVL